MEWIKTHWTKEDYDRLRQKLRELAEPEYRAFHSSLVPDNQKILGVRVPKLRALAKEIAKGDVHSYWELCGTESYEEITLQGFVLGYSVKEYGELLRLLDEYLEKVDNWAACDCVCSSLKLIQKHAAKFFQEIPRLLSDQNPWKVRAGLVLMLDYYLTEENAEECLRRCDAVHREEYYIRMAQAWLVSMAYVKFPELTRAYLNICTLDNWTYRKAIQKARESYRVSPEDKALLQELKQKRRSSYEDTYGSLPGI